MILTDRIKKYIIYMFSKGDVTQLSIEKIGDIYDFISTENCNKSKRYIKGWVIRDLWEAIECVKSDKLTLDFWDDCGGYFMIKSIVSKRIKGEVEIDE